MLFSLLRITFFFILMGSLAFAAVWLGDNGGTLRLVFAGTEFTLGPVQLMIGAVLLFLFVWLTIRLVGLILATLRFLTGDETAISRYFNRNRERRGFEALSDGLIALASGDARAAYKASTKAEKLLGRPELTDLITAQAADRLGETQRATESWKRLLGDERTRFAAVRGLIGQRLKAKDDDAAFALAEKAMAMRPDNAEMQDTLLRLQAARGDWAGARTILRRKYSTGQMPKDVWRRRDAVLALGEAQIALDHDEIGTAQDLAIAANKQAPDLVAAAVLAARAQVERGRPKDAAKLLKRSYDLGPHPDLAAAFAAIAGDETAEARLKRMKTLLSGHETTAEARMTLAEMLIAAEDFPEARRTLLPLTEGPTEARAMTLMAAAERGLGNDDAMVRGWLARAVTAPRGPQWVCGNCAQVAPSWRPACPHCHALDTLTWTTAAGAPESLPGANVTLPLLVGGHKES